jgi:hypothetical protein
MARPAYNPLKTYRFKSSAFPFEAAAKVPATLDAEDVTGNLPAEVKAVASEAGYLLQSADEGATEVTRGKTGYALSSTGMDAVVLPADILTAASVKADAVTKIQAGLATPTNITAGTITTVTNLTNLPAIPTDWLTAAGVSAAAVTKIQNGLSTYDGSDTAGTTTLLSRIVGTLDTGTHKAQTGDSYAVVTHVTHGNAAILARGNEAWSLGTTAPTGWLNAAVFATDAISAAALSAAAVTKLQTGLATQTSVDEIAADVVKVPKVGMIHHYRNVETEAEATVEISAVE